jgi:hypothetical protein
MRVLSVSLDMPLADTQALDEQFLEVLYQGDYGRHMSSNVGGYLGDNVRSSGLSESPFYHIDTVLKDGRKLQLWFSSADDGRRTFGVHLGTPYMEKSTRDLKQAVMEIQQAWGKPDLEFVPPLAAGAQQIQVFIDHTMPKDRLAAVVSRLPSADKLTPEEMNHFWESDLRDYSRSLGNDFRGAIAILSQQNGKLVGEQILLLDLVRARTIFNLSSGK